MISIEKSMPLGFCVYLVVCDNEKSLAKDMYLAARWRNDAVRAADLSRISWILQNYDFFGV